MKETRGQAPTAACHVPSALYQTQGLVWFLTLPHLPHPPLSSSSKAFTWHLLLYQLLIPGVFS